MALEVPTYISDLVSTNPTGTDPKNQGDDHIRYLKAAIKATFPNITGAVTPTHTLLNTVGVTQTLGNNTTNVASTAFVQAAIAAVNAQTALTLSNVSGTTQAAAAGSMYVLQNVAATTVTLPASPTTGDTIAIIVGNSLTTNTFDLNGKSLTAPNGVYTGTMTMNKGGSITLKYTGATTMWVAL